MDTSTYYLIGLATIAVVLIISTSLPYIVSIINKNREIKASELRHQAEQDARRAREEDIATLLNNLIRVDTAMDYINSRGSNKEHKLEEVLALLEKEKEA